MSESRCDGPVVGETVGNFLIVSKIGRGGMGEVFLAEQKSVKTRVAIKTLLPHISSDNDQVQRFFNEAIAVSRIRHAGIAKIFDVGFLPCGRAYLAMEYLEGETLTRRIRRSGRLSLGHLADIARQIASVLDATHQAGITHRDLKPDNVFLVPDAELESGERVKILDFGIAKLSGVSLTQPSVGTMGTPDYMAPEQWQDSRTVDWHVDAYALGCLAFEMATGRVPFPAASIAEAYAKHLKKPPPAIRDLVPEMPEELDAVVLQLLQKQPEGRPATMKAITRAFAALGTGQPGLLAPTLAPMGPILGCPTVASGIGQLRPGSASNTPATTLAPATTNRALLGLLGSIGLVLLGILITLVVSLEERDEIAPLDKQGQPVAVQTAPIVETTAAASVPPPAEAAVDPNPAPKQPSPSTARRTQVSTQASGVGARRPRESVRPAPSRWTSEPEPIDPYAAETDLVPPIASMAKSGAPAPIATTEAAARPVLDPGEELDDATVAVGLSSVQPQVSLCASQSADPITVQVRARIDVFGHVAEVSSVQARVVEVGACVVKELRSATFPNTTNGGWFSHRFVFDRGSR